MVLETTKASNLNSAILGQVITNRLQDGSYNGIHVAMAEISVLAGKALNEFTAGHDAGEMVKVILPY